MTEPPRFRQIRTETEKLERLRELLPGLRHRADSLGHGIAGREIQHVANIIDGILNDNTIAPVTNQAERQPVEEGL